MKNLKKSSTISTNGTTPNTDGTVRNRFHRRRIIVASFCVALGMALFGAVAPASASDIATTPVPGNGETITTLTYTAPDGLVINTVLYAHWSGVSGSSATLDSVRVCAGTIPGASLIAPVLYTQGGTDSATYGSKVVQSTKCNTWEIHQTYGVYAGNVYTQVGLQWYTGAAGAAYVTAQYEVG